MRASSDLSTTHSNDNWQALVDEIESIICKFNVLTSNIKNAKQMNEYNSLVKTVYELKEEILKNGDMNDAETYSNTIERWQNFIRAIIVDNPDAVTLLIDDVKNNPLAKKNRYRTLCHQFHPDRNRNKLILTNELATQIMQIINSDAIRISDADFLSIDELIRRAGECIDSYNETTQDSSIDDAIELLKKALHALHSDIRFNDLPNCLVAIQNHAKVTNYLSKCYVTRHRYFEAQLYLVSSGKIIDSCIISLSKRSGEHATEINTFKVLYGQIEKNIENLKSTSIENDSQYVARACTTSSKSENKSSDGVIVILPESSLVKYRYETPIIRHVNEHQRESKVVGRIMQGAGATAGMVGFGVGVGSVINGITVLSASTLLPPVIWVLGGAVLAYKGVNFGLEVVDQGDKLASAAARINEINGVIDMAMTCYCSGYYQQFINCLSDPDYFKISGTPLLKYNPMSPSAPIGLVDTDKNINFIDTLLKHGFRPDGIAFLINVIVEVVISGRVESRQRRSRSAYLNGLFILNQVIDDQMLKEKAKTLDERIRLVSRVQEEQIRNEEKIEDVKWYEKIWKYIGNYTANASYTMKGEYDKVVTSEYINDYQQLTISNRLNEMINIAKINYAIANFLYTGNYELSIDYFNDVESYYENTDPTLPVYQKLELIREMQFAFNILNESSSACSVIDSKYKSFWFLHTEANQSDDVELLRQHIEPKVHRAMNELADVSDISDEYKLIQVLMAVDYLKIAITCENWDVATSRLSQMIATIRDAKINFGEQFKYTYNVILNLYSLGLRRRLLDDQTINYLSSELSKLSNRELTDLCSTLEDDLRARSISRQVESMYYHTKIVSLSEAIKFILTDDASEFVSYMFSIIINRMPVVSQIEEVLNVIANNPDCDLSKMTDSNYYPIINKYLKDNSMETLLYQWLFLAESDPTFRELLKIINARLSVEFNSSPLTARKIMFESIIKNIHSLKALRLNMTITQMPKFLTENTANCQAANAQYYHIVAHRRLNAEFESDMRAFSDKSKSDYLHRLYAVPTINTDIKKYFRERVIGQKSASEIVEDIIISFTQRAVSDKPAVLLFCGPTGVGKTELAECAADAINKYILKNTITDTLKRPIIKICMEEYQESHAVAKLIGSPAGYIGSQDKPHFAQKLDQFAVGDGVHKIVKNVVILFDELEKAHENVKQSLLGLFDTGTKSFSYEEDRVNVAVEYEFKNCLFIGTTNLLSDQIAHDFESGKPLNEIQNNLKSDFINHSSGFSPEFLNRLTVVPFRTIPHGEIYQAILDRHLYLFFQKLKAQYQFKSIEIIPDMKRQILEAIENDHYNNGLGIRSFIQWLEGYFKSFFAKLNVALLSNACLQLGFDSDVGAVSISLIPDLPCPIVIDRDNEGNRFYLQNESAQLRELPRVGMR